MDRLNKSTKYIAHAIIVLLFALGLNMVTAGEAQARGQFEFDGGFGYVGRFEKNQDDFHGFAFSLALRYRIVDFVALGIEQDLGGMFQDDDSKYHNGFYGATIFGAKFIYAINQIELFGNVGIGADYVDMEHDAHHNHHLGDPWHDAHHEWDDARFALRLGIGGTYMMQQNIGIGLNLDYTPSFKDDFVIHYLRLQLHLVFLF
ncbi:MAG: outer membrane beta-barrel protein [Proteobacteria bacterium]|nr:outer membrane beta-barrel protein [Pseudomonadota bacterium]